MIVGENRSKGRSSNSDVFIATTHPAGEGVKRYKNILEERLGNRHGSKRSPDEEFNIFIDEYRASEILRAALYGGLEHEGELHEKVFMGEEDDSEYTLVINKSLEEMVLLIDGDTYPLRPSLSRLKKFDLEIN